MSNELFQLHKFERLGEVRQFGDWLLACINSGQPVALAIKKRQKLVALATHEDAWVIDLRTELGVFAMSSLQQQIERLTFLMRNAAQDIPVVMAFLDQGTPVIKVIGDLTGMAYCINQPVTVPTKFKRIEHDAYETVMLVSQYQKLVPPYFEKVALPNALWEAANAMADKLKVDWIVDYEDLWLKVMGFYTQDPTLLYDLYEGTDPREKIARIFEIMVPEAEMYLLYAACGFSTDTVRKHFPARVKDLPDNLDSVRETIARKLPTLTANINSMVRTYHEDRIATTLYGRLLRSGHTGTDAVAFRIFGTVDDLVGVAAASYWTNRNSDDTMIIGISALSNNNWRILGHGPSNYAEKLTWQTTLKELSPLADPLGQANPLRPKIVELP